MDWFITVSDSLTANVMRITVRFRGPITTRVGKAEIEMEVDRETSLRALLETLIVRESNIGATWASPEQICQNTLMLCDGVDVELTGGLDTKLKNGNSVVILPLVHGGQT